MARDEALDESVIPPSKSIATVTVLVLVVEVEVVEVGGVPH